MTSLLSKLLLLAVAAVSAENCGGSLSVDPRYCVTRNPDNVVDGTPQLYCSNTNLLVGDTVPLRIRVENNANFEDRFGDRVEVPAQLVRDKNIQIVFACTDGATCSQASHEALVYDNRYDPSVASTFSYSAASNFKGIDLCGENGFPAGACGHITLDDVDLNRRPDDAAVKAGLPTSPIRAAASS